MLNKIRLIGVGVVLLVIAAVAGFTFMKGDGTVHLVAAPNSTLELVVNGQVLAPKSSQYDHQKYDLPQGKHEIEVRDPAAQTSKKYSLEVKNGFAEFLLPKDDDQCFARFDVTDTLYSSKGSLPEVTDKWTRAEPIDVPGTAYFHEDEAPSSIKQGNKVHLVLAVPCSRISGNDAAILAEVGY